MPIQIPGMFEDYPEMLRNSPNPYNQPIAAWLDDMRNLQRAAFASAAARQQAASPSVNTDFLANLNALSQNIPTTLTTSTNQEAPGFWSQVWNRAIDPVQGSLYGMVGLFGDLIGNDTIRDWGVEGYQRNLLEAEEGNKIAPRQVPTVEDIDSLGDAATWLEETVADQIPNLALMASSGGIGGAVGKAIMNRLGQSAARKLAANRMKALAADTMAGAVEKGIPIDLAKTLAENAAKRNIPGILGTKLGASAGLLGSIGSLESGSAYGEDVKKHGVEGTSPWMDLGVGVANASIDYALGMEGSILRNMLGGAVPASAKQSIRNTLTAGAKKLLTSATKEGTAEALQETTQMLNEKLQDNNLGTITPEDTSRLLNAFVAGGALGGLMAPIDAIASRRRPTQNADADVYKNVVFNPLLDEVYKIPNNISNPSEPNATSTIVNQEAAPFDSLDNDFLNSWANSLDVPQKLTPFQESPDNDFLNSWANNLKTSQEATPLQSLTKEAQDSQTFFNQAKDTINTKYADILNPVQQQWDATQASLTKIQATPAAQLGLTEDQKNGLIQVTKKQLISQAAKIASIKEQQRAELDKLNKQETTQKNKLAKNVLNTAEQFKQQPLTQDSKDWAELMNLRKGAEDFSVKATQDINNSLNIVNSRISNLLENISSASTRGLTPKDIQSLRAELKALRKEKTKLTGSLRKVSNLSERIRSKTSNPKKMYTSLLDAQVDLESLYDFGTIEDVTDISSDVNAPIVDAAAKQQDIQEKQINDAIKQQQKEKAASNKKKTKATGETNTQARGKYPDEETVLTKSNPSAIEELATPAAPEGTASTVNANNQAQQQVQPTVENTPEQASTLNVEEKAQAREDIANTPEKSRILPTDNNLVVKRKIVEQLKNAGRGNRAADEAQILMRMLQTLQEITGETPAQVMQRLNFSLNAPVDEQIKKSLEQTAYHGTPFSDKIDRLSTDYMGSGEGAQVHGWGLYVALNEKIARRYQKMRAKPRKLATIRINNETFTLGDYSKQNLIQQVAANANFSKTYTDLLVYLISNSANIREYAQNINDIIQLGNEIKNATNRILRDFGTEYSSSPEYLRQYVNYIYTITQFSFYSDFTNINSLAASIPLRTKILSQIQDINAIVDDIIYKLNTIQNTHIVKEKTIPSQPGQRFRVEIPEDSTMLREEANFNEQSKYVQEALINLFKERYIHAGSDITVDDILTAIQNKTGEAICQSIDRILNTGNPKDTSLALNKVGIKGIRYKGHRDGECAVIFNDEDIDIVERFYDQQGRGRVDFLQDGTARIIFRESADASTAIHEFEHFFMNEVGRILNDTTISNSPAKQQLIQDIQRLGEFAGESQETAGNPHNWSTEAHEKVAKSFELYFRTGKAPEGYGLEALFKRMKDLLVQLYKKATSILGIRNLPKDIKQVFDRQLIGYKKEAKSNQIARNTTTAEMPQNGPEMASTATKNENTGETSSLPNLNAEEQAAVDRLLNLVQANKQTKPVNAGPINTSVFDSISKTVSSVTKSYPALANRINTIWAPTEEHAKDLAFISPDNNITLIASNIEKYAKQTGKSIQDITKLAIKHEGLGHYGLRTVLDNRGLSKFLDDVYNSFSGTQVWELFTQSSESFSNLPPRQQAEEFCAALAEQMETTPKAPALVKTAWTKLKTLVKPLLNGLGVSSLNKPFTLNKKSGTLTQQDIIEVLKAGANKLSNVNTEAMSSPEVDMSRRMPDNPEATRLDLAIQEANRTLLGRGIDALHDPELRKDYLENSREYFLERFVDALRPIQQMMRKLKERGGNITYATNLYKKLQALPNRTAVHLIQAQTDYVKPLIQAIIATGKPGEKAEITFARFSEYVEAKAGLERNQVREQQKSWTPKESPISGYSNDHWIKLIDKHRSPEMDAAVSEIQKLNHARVELMRKEKLLPADMLDNWEAKYKYYMPFKSWENVIQEAAPEWYKGDTRRNLSTPNLQLRLGKQAKGKEGMSQNPVAHAVMQLYDVVYLADKVNAGRGFLQLVEDNPDATDIFEKVIFREAGKEGLKKWGHFKRVVDKKTGDIEYVKTKSTAEGMMSDTVAIIDNNGDIQRILVKDDKVLRALKGENIIQAGPMLRWIGNLTHTLGKYVTSRNPLFWLRNPIRDTITAAINIQAVAHELESIGFINANEIARAIVTKGLANAFKKNSVRGALFNYYRTGDTNFKGFDQETQRYMQNFKDFLEYGGQTEYFGTNVYEAIKKDLTDAIATSNPQTKAEKAKSIIDKYGKYMDSISNALENQTRYIAFNEIVSGITNNAEEVSPGVYKRPNGELITEQEIKERAANIALNLTVNFSRKGSWAPVFNSLFMFASASIGGNVRMLETLFAKDPKTGKVSAKNLIRFSAYPLLGYAVQAAIARALMPDDDDGVNKYDKIPSYIKDSNLIIPSPLFDGSYITLPLPYGFNIFWAMARGIVDSATGTAEGTPSPSIMKVMTNTLSNAFDNFASIGQTSEGLNMFIPSIFRPLYQLSINKNFVGNPIMPEGNSYARGEIPDSQKYWSTTNDTVKSLCKWFNEATFGSEVESGLIDISPETLEHFTTSYLGGLGRIFFGMMGRFDDLIRGKGFDAGKVPGINIFYHTPQDSDTSALFSKLRTEAMNRINIFDNARKSPDMPLQDRLAAMQAYQDSYRIKGILNRIQTNLNKIRQQERLIDRSNLSISEKTRRLEQLKQKKTALMMRFNKAAIKAGITNVD